MSERSITAVEDPRRDHLLGSSAVESQWQSNEMLGAVPIPPEDARCAAISLRSGKRCKRYRQASSSVCSKHAKRASSTAQPVQRGVDHNGSGLGKPNPPAGTAAGRCDEEEWAARFDPANQWVCCELEKTNPELASALWELLSRVETELPPDLISDLALWLRDVLEGTASLLEVPVGR